MWFQNVLTAIPLVLVGVASSMPLRTLSFLAVPSPCSSFLTPFPLSGGSSKAAGGGSSKQAAAALAKQQRSKQQQAHSRQAPEGKS